MLFMEKFSSCKDNGITFTSLGETRSCFTLVQYLGRPSPLCTIAGFPPTFL